MQAEFDLGGSRVKAEVVKQEPHAVYVSLKDKNGKDKLVRRHFVKHNVKIEGGEADSD